MRISPLLRYRLRRRTRAALHFVRSAFAVVFLVSALPFALGALVLAGAGFVLFPPSEKVKS